MSGAGINHTLIPWERSGSQTVSLPCYCGFVIHSLLSILLDYFILLQGTQVSEDHEVRQNLCYITEGVPQRHAIQSVAKYTGTQSEPQWMDVEQGVCLIFSTTLRRSLKSSRQIRDTVLCTGRSLYCSVSDKAWKIGPDVLHTGIRGDITCRPHRT